MEIEQVRIRSILFEIEIKKNKPIGQAVINFSLVYEGTGGREFETRIPLDTLWIYKQEKKAIKSHLRISTGNVLHKLLYATIHKFGFVKTPEYNQFLTSDKRGIIRYGAKSGSLFSDSDENHETFYVYDSYAQTIRHCLVVVNRYRQIGGLDIVALSKVDKNILTEFGFEEIKDVFGIGPSMWKGNADLFLKMSSGYVPSSELSKNAKAFLGYIKRSLEKE